MKKALIAIAATFSIGAALQGVAFAEPVVAKTEKQAQSAVQFRQALLQLVRSNVGALGAMAKGQIPYDQARIEKNAMRIEQLSLMMEDYFAVDTRGFKLDTDALDKVWGQHDEFKGKISDLTAAARALKLAAQNGQQDQYKSAIGGVMSGCKGCHDSFKAD